MPDSRDHFCTCAEPEPAMAERPEAVLAHSDVAERYFNPVFGTHDNLQTLRDARGRLPCRVVI